MKYIHGFIGGTEKKKIWDYVNNRMLTDDFRCISEEKDLFEMDGQASEALIESFQDKSEG